MSDTAFSGWTMDKRPEGAPDGIRIDGVEYPFACPTCGGSGQKDSSCPTPDGPCGYTVKCPDCIDGRNPALEWVEWCVPHESVLWGGGDHGAVKRCQWTTDEKPYHMDDCEFRWAAIGVAE